VLLRAYHICLRQPARELPNPAIHSRCAMRLLESGYRRQGLNQATSSASARLHRLCHAQEQRRKEHLQLRAHCETSQLSYPRVERPIATVFRFERCAKINGSQEAELFSKSFRAAGDSLQGLSEGLRHVMYYTGPAGYFTSMTDFVLSPEVRTRYGRRVESRGHELSVHGRTADALGT